MYILLISMCISKSFLCFHISVSHILSDPQNIAWKTHSSHSAMLYFSNLNISVERKKRTKI